MIRDPASSGFIDRPRFDQPRLTDRCHHIVGARRSILSPAAIHPK
jgi:hypothetical protein